MSDKLERLKAMAEEIGRLSTYEMERKKNRKRLKALFDRLQLEEKAGAFEKIFHFKAINLSSISLAKATLGEASEGKYAQIIAIEYIEKEGKSRAKNINLRYFGRADKLEAKLKEQIVEFILRWRLEKSLMGVDHYRELLQTLENRSTPAN